MVLVRPEENQNPDGVAQGASIKVKTPKRVLHFSDGVLEEYSTDEEEVVDKSNNSQQTVVDPATLTWGPWFLYKAWAAGSSTLSLIDTVGEYLASFFGITTPRYYFELEEYKKRDEEQKKQQEAEQGWSQPSASTVCVPLKEISTNQPKPVEV